MRYTHRLLGTCSSSVSFDINDGVVSNVKFEQGCGGNLQGIAALSEGRGAEEIISLCGSIRCGSRSTSCPAQFSIALRKALEKQREISRK